MPSKKNYIEQHKAKIKKLKDRRDSKLIFMDKINEIKKKKWKRRFDKAIKEKEALIKYLQTPKKLRR